MATLYHGTTLENWESIQKKGWNNGEKKVWNCSEDAVYFRNLEKYKNEYENREQIESAILFSCGWNAIIGAATQNYQKNELIVLRYEIPDEFIRDDYSCPHMASEANEVSTKDMIHAKLTGKFLSKDYLPSMRLFYLNGMLEHTYSNAASNLSYIEMQTMAKGLPYIDELFETEWEEISLT